MEIPSKNNINMEMQKHALFCKENRIIAPKFNDL